MESLCHGIDFISTNYPFLLSSTGRALTIVHDMTSPALHSNSNNDKDNDISVDDGDDTSTRDMTGAKRTLSNVESYVVKRTKLEANKTQLLVMKSGSYR